MTQNPLPRVLHISTPITWRGGEQQVAYLLQELKQQGWPATVLCKKGSILSRFCRENQIETLLFSRRGLNNMLLGRELYKLCKKRPFDLVHAHDPHAHAGAVFASQLGNTLPLVVSRRVDFPIRDSWFSRRKYNHPAIKAIVCVSEAIRRTIEPAIRNKEVLQVIYSGINPARFQVEVPRGSLRAQYSIPEDHILVGNVSALAPHKDYPSFFKMAALLLEHNPRMSFLAIGEGAERKNLEALIHTMGLENNVRITGFRNDIPQLFPQLDIMVFTSMAEGLGTTVLDAFAARVPVVATAAGGIPEMVEHHKTGMLAPVGDPVRIAACVREVLEDPILRESLIAGGQERLRQFTCQATASRTMELYSKLTQNHKQPQ